MANAVAIDADDDACAACSGPSSRQCRQQHAGQIAIRVVLRRIEPEPETRQDEAGGVGIGAPASQSCFISRLRAVAGRRTAAARH